MRGRIGRPRAIYCSFRDTFSFSVPEFELFGGCAVSACVYFLIAYYFHSFGSVCNGNGKNRPVIILMFTTCLVHPGGRWYMPRLLFIGGYSHEVTYSLQSSWYSIVQKC